MNNQITKEKWNSIINNYFTNYYDNESTRIKRRNYRALYLSNAEYLKNRHLNINTKNNIIMYNNWYLNYYNNLNNL